MDKLRFWVEVEAIKMTDEKFVFNALGVYGIGYNLERLEWAIATVNDAAQLAPFFERLRW